MYGDVENVDVISANGSMNRHTVYQNNSLKWLINYNDRDGIDINNYLKNDDVSRGIGLINSHILSQFNE